MKLLKGEVHFGRVSGSDDYFRIAVQDDLSRLRVIEIRIRPEDMGDLLGLRGTPCEFDYLSSPNIGKKEETKKVWIDFPKLPYEEKEARTIVNPILKKYEVDGWVAWPYTVYNCRHLAQQKTVDGKEILSFEVVFHRYV